MEKAKEAIGRLTTRKSTKDFLAMQEERKNWPAVPEGYDVGEDIGRGVSATVHVAYCEENDEWVAVKKMNLESMNCDLEEVIHEAQTMRRFNHPNVLPIYTSFVHSQELWIVMPYCPGGSVLHIMKYAYPEGLDEVLIASVGREVLKALDYVHRQGGIHRDVKCGNILIDQNGTVKLGDFGVAATQTRGASWGHDNKARMTFVGTPCWMAPEVMEQTQGYGSPADIWSFGITLLEMAYGHAPFAKFPPMKVLLMTLQNAPPTLEDKGKRHFSKALKDVVAMCLQKEVARRPTAAQLLEHKFFKAARDDDFLRKALLDNVPSLAERVQLIRQGKAASTPAENDANMQRSAEEYKKGVSSWNFDVAALKAQAALEADPANELSTITENEEGEETLTGASAMQVASFISSQSNSPAVAATPTAESQYQQLQPLQMQMQAEPPARAATPPPLPPLPPQASPLSRPTAMSAFADSSIQQPLTGMVLNLLPAGSSEGGRGPAPEATEDAPPVGLTTSKSVGAGLQSVGIGSDQSQLTVGAKQKKGRFQVSQVVDTSMGGGMVASSSQPGLATEGSVTTPPAAAAGATTTTSAADGGADIASTSNAAGASSRLHVLTAAGGSSYGLAAEGGAAPDINIGLPPLAPATTSALAHGDGTTATGSGGGAAPEDGKEAKKEQRGRFKVNVLEGNVGAPLPEPVSRSMSGMHRISSGAALPTSGLGSATTSSTGMKVDTDTAAMSISGLYGGVTSPHGSDAGYMAMPTTPHGAGSGPGGLPPLPPQAPPPLVLPLQQQGQAAAPVPAPAGAGPSAAPAASSPAAVQNVLPSVISCLVGLIEQTSSHQEALQGLMMTVVQAVGTVKPLPIPEEHLAHLRQQIANNQKDRRELDRQLLTLSNIVHNQYHR